MEFPSLSVRDLARNLRSQKISSSELVTYHEARINKLNPSVNALCELNIDRAKAEALVADEQVKKGPPAGRLSGVFYTAKESIDVAGLKSGHGSHHGPKGPSKVSNTLIQRLAAEGAICIGKGNMAEYGKSYYTENPVYGRTNSPFDLKRSPGGSSGGDAAALACSFASFSIAADSGGSVRVPANFCGVFGLYPTRGTLSDGLSWSPPHAVSSLFRCNGLLTRHLSDLEVLFSVLNRYDPLDPFSIPMPPQAIDRRFSAKKFLFFSAMNGVACDPAISGEISKTVKKLEALGYQGEERCPKEFAACFEIFIILAAQASLQLEDLSEQDAGTPRDLSKEGKTLKSLRQRVAAELPPLTSEMVLRCWSRVDKLRFSLQPLWQEYDFVISPVTATLPPLHDTSKYPVGGKELQSQEVFQFASAVNVLGVPAIAFPTALSTEKLPLGLQIIGPRFSEFALMEVIRTLGYSSCLAPAKT